jgi:hypothetical protein
MRHRECFNARSDLVAVAAKADTIREDPEAEDPADVQVEGDIAQVVENKARAEAAGEGGNKSLYLSQNV